MTAVLDIVRLHLLDRRLVAGTLLAVPVFVALGVGITAAEVAATGSFGRGFATGTVGGFYGGIAAVHLTSIVRLLPFAVAMGRTRRDVHLGTLLFTLLMALAVGALLHLALVVERTTGGWGAGLQFLGARWAGVANPVGQYLVVTAPLLVTFPLTVLVAVVLVRWGPSGLVAAGIIGGVVAFGVLVAVGLLTADAGAAVLTTTLLVALGLVAAVAGWGVLRRAPV